MSEIRIGISGWRYAPWRGVFYPPDLPQRAELEFAADNFRAIEINGTFYSLQRPESFTCWYDSTPSDFVFAVKGGRYITHIRRLNDVKTPLANFFASGLFNLREKLGPLLWQFPPFFKYDRQRIEAFFKLLPHDTDAALKLARGRDARMKGRARLAVDTHRAVRHAMEIRNESFRDASFIDLLRQYNVALVIADTAKRWPYIEDLTADFLYLRLHGEKQLYKSGYPDKSLDRWAERISAWARGSEPTNAVHASAVPAPRAPQRDIYCFFDNTDAKLRAPFDARKLMVKLDLRARPRSLQRRWKQPSAARASNPMH